MPLPAILTGLGATFTLSTFVKATVIWFIANVFCKVVYRLLFSLGFGVIAYGGVELLLDEAFDLIQDSLTSLGPTLEATLNRARVTEGLGIMASAATFAITTRLARSFVGFRGQPDQQRW